MVKEPPRVDKRGGKRIAKGEVVIIGSGRNCKVRIEEIAWRKLGEERETSMV